MTNAYVEILRSTASKDIIAIDIECHGAVFKTANVDDVPKILELLKAVNYDSGYGYQELGGTIWLSDGSWYERGEYDGSEWWEHKLRPPLPWS